MTLSPSGVNHVWKALGALHFSLKRDLFHAFVFHRETTEKRKTSHLQGLVVVVDDSLLGNWEKERFTVHEDHPADRTD